MAEGWVGKMSIHLTLKKETKKEKRRGVKKTNKNKKKNKKREKSRWKDKETIANNETNHLASDVTVHNLHQVNSNDILLGKSFTVDSDVVQKAKKFSSGVHIGVLNNEPILWMFFYPFVNMTLEDKEEFQEFLYFLDKDRQLHNSISSNSAHIGGHMYGVGWRPGYITDQVFGLYSPKSGVSESTWANHIAGLSKVLILYSKWFQKLSSRAYSSACTFMKVNKIPGLGFVEWTLDKMREGLCAFASNLTYTFGRFYNRGHKDRDAGPYTFGIWFPVTENFTLASHEMGFKCNGGQFIWGEYGLGADFGQCDGVTMLVWRGALDTHFTVKPEISSGFDLIGTSVQIGNALVQRVKKHIDKLNASEPTKSVGGLMYQLEKIKVKK